MATKITNQVAHFSANSSIIVTYERAQITVDVGVVDRLIELFRDTRQLRNQTQSVNDERGRVLTR